MQTQLSQILLIFSLLILLLICVQDFKYRAVHWFLFPLLGILILAYNNTSTDAFNQHLSDYLLNISFISIQLLAVFIFYRIKSKRFQNIIDSKIGLGDILMFLILAISFSVLNFILFFTLSLILSLTLHLLLRHLRIIKDPRIPLASYLSIFYGFVLVGFKINAANPMINIINFY